MAMWQAPPPHLATDPAVIELASGGVTALELDLAPYLAEGETPRHPRAVLTEMGTDNRQEPRATLRGAVLVVAIRGLVPGRDYLLSRGWTVNALKQPTKLTVVRCIG